MLMQETLSYLELTQIILNRDGLFHNTLIIYSFLTMELFARMLGKK